MPALVCPVPLGVPSLTGLALTSAGDGSMSLLVYTGRSTAMYIKPLGTVFKMMAGNCSPHPVGLFHR